MVRKHSPPTIKDKLGQKECGAELNFPPLGRVSCNTIPQNPVDVLVLRQNLKFFHREILSRPAGG